MWVDAKEVAQATIKNKKFWKKTFEVIQVNREKRV